MRRVANWHSEVNFASIPFSEVSWKAPVLTEGCSSVAAEVSGVENAHLGEHECQNDKIRMSWIGDPAVCVYSPSFLKL